MINHGMDFRGLVHKGNSEIKWMLWGQPPFRGDLHINHIVLIFRPGIDLQLNRIFAAGTVTLGTPKMVKKEITSGNFPALSFIKSSDSSSFRHFYQEPPRTILNLQKKHMTHDPRFGGLLSHGMSCGTPSGKNHCLLQFPTKWSPRSIAKLGQTTTTTRDNSGLWMILVVMTN